MGMKHYLWFKADGTLGGDEVASGGFPLEVDLDSPNPTHPLAVQIKAARVANNPEFAGYYGYDCGCDPADVFCSCANDRMRDSYMVGNVLTTKPVVEMVLDSVVQASNTPDDPVVKTAGGNIAFKLQAPSGGIPNGTVFSIQRGGGPDMVAAWPITLTWTDDETNEVALVAPPKGMLSGFGVFHPRYCTTLRLVVKGW